jgi:hypothetical protein
MEAKYRAMAISSILASSARVVVRGHRFLTKTGCYLAKGANFSAHASSYLEEGLQ